MARAWVLPVLAVAWLVAAPTSAQEPRSGSRELPPGVFDAIPQDAATVEINLSGAMLRLVAAAAEVEEPEFAALVRGLERVQVRFAEDVDPELGPTLLEGVELAAESLRRAGWTQQVSIREGSERVMVFGREEAGRLTGLTILFVEESEAGVVHLVGEVDPDRLGVLTQGLALPDLGLDVGGGSDVEPDPEDRP